jgi:hypothetical protein
MTALTQLVATHAPPLPALVANAGLCGRWPDQYQLTGYDAAYLELAVRHKLPVASLDRALSRAALAVGVNTVQALRRPFAGANGRRLVSLARVQPLHLAADRGT